MPNRPKLYMLTTRNGHKSLLDLNKLERLTMEDENVPATANGKPTLIFHFDSNDELMITFDEEEHRKAAFESIVKEWRKDMEHEELKELMTEDAEETE